MRLGSGVVRRMRGRENGPETLHTSGNEKEIGGTALIKMKEDPVERKKKSVKTKKYLNKIM